MHFIGAFALLMLYMFLFVALLPILLKTLLKLPNELMRKTQHIAYAFSIFFYTDVFASYPQALLAIGIVLFMFFIGLWMLERKKQYKSWLADRHAHGGELKTSLLQAQMMFAVLITLFGILLPSTHDDIIIISVMTWGFGDALAAVIGKRFGKRKNMLMGADHKKTMLGSHALFLSAFLVISVSLFIITHYVWWSVLVMAVLVAALATIVEAYMKEGFDTFILPLSVALSLYGLILWFEYLGVL